jgi:ABC-type dipeptide/oligopeptide/nickel transport system permease subunit
MTAPAPAYAPAQRATRRFLAHRRGMAACAVLVALLLVVFLGPLIWNVDPAKIDLAHTMAPVSLAHPLGTDENGRDVLARLLQGGRVSLLVGVAAMAVSVSIGVVLGAVAGYVGGKVDQLVVQVVDGAMAIPLFFLWLIFLTSVPPTIATIVLVIGCTSWMPTARVVRSEILAARSLEFVEAARSIGASHLRILRKHCLPQATSSSTVSATIAAAFAILSEAVEILKRYPDLRVEVAGHTDQCGKDAYNQSLSERRAKAVYDYLTTNGVDAGRLVGPIGYGESRPLEDLGQAFPACKSEKNRRTELNVQN